ncbi:MAG: DUF262 domain-containing HNH endonuclease family protein [Fibrobacteraceae bacterium]|nr:DUF262 domain-containing HNH endonuclease family protein [Fibrobacteraceae bacterium]
MRAESKSFSYLSEIQTFEIPFFQRAYVWKKDNWEDLFDDLIRVEQRHFLGSIILKRILLQNGISLAQSHVSVIDGQQRITTLSILLKAIYDSFDEEVKKNAADAIKNTLFYKKSKTSSEYLIKLRHSKVDRIEFEKVIGSVSDSGISVIDASELEGLDVDDENSLRKIICCYKYFSERLKEYSQDDRDALFNSLLDDNNKMLVIIELDEFDHEQQIFDTINSAGVRLTSTDIVKNALFQKVLEFDHDEKEVYDFYDRTWNECFSQDDDDLHYWAKKKTIGRIQRDNSEMLLQSVAIIEKIFDPNEHTLTDLPDLYKDRIKSLSKDEIREFIKKIIEYANIYRENVPEINKTTLFSYSDASSRLFQILDVLGLNTFNPYILFLLKRYQKDEPTKLARMADLERFVIRRMIAGESTKGYNKNCIEFIDDELKAGQMANLVTNDEVFKGLTKIKNREATLLLFWIELKRRYDDNKFDLKSLQYDYTLEHVMPQKWTDHWSDQPYMSLTGEPVEDIGEGKRIRSVMVYSLGNMTLLNGKLNSAISNSDFKTKMEGTSKKRKGIKEYVALSITSKDVIANVYNQGKSWTEQVIYNRQEQLCREIFGIWGIGGSTFNVPENLNDLSEDISKPMERKVSKAAAAKLSVTRADGSVISETSAGDTVVSALKDVVKAVGISAFLDYAKDNLPSFDGQPFFKKGPHKGSQSNPHEICKGYYANMHSNTEAKKRYLEKTSDHFGLGWKVEMVKK